MWWNRPKTNASQSRSFCSRLWATFSPWKALYSVIFTRSHWSRCGRFMSLLLALSSAQPRYHPVFTLSHSFLDIWNVPESDVPATSPASPDGGVTGTARSVRDSLGDEVKRED